MILFPPAKINLGLRVIFKRNDGYHEIDSCMLAIGIHDIIEITKASDFEFVQSGIVIDGRQDDNLCVKAFQLIKIKSFVCTLYDKSVNRIMNMVCFIN